MKEPGYQRYAGQANHAESDIAGGYDDYYSDAKSYGKLYGHESQHHAHGGRGPLASPESQEDRPVVPRHGGKSRDTYPEDIESQPPGDVYCQDTFAYIGGKGDNAEQRTCLPPGCQGTDVTAALLPDVNPLFQAGDDIGEGDRTQQIADDNSGDNVIDQLFILLAFRIESNAYRPGAAGIAHDGTELGKPHLDAVEFRRNTLLQFFGFIQGVSMRHRHVHR